MARLAQLVLGLMLVLALLPPAGAQDIGDSEAVAYMHAEVIRQGTVTLKASTGTATDLNITLSVPQNSTRQISFVKELKGPDNYAIIKDSWGNDMIVLQWKKPPVNQPVFYRLVSDVEVFDKDVHPLGRKFATTNLTESDSGIAEKAFGLAAGKSGIQAIFGLAEWVHKWVKYDEGCGESARSARWAFRERRGVCDEFSVLLISMLRELGYNAYYVAGYAHSNKWGQHGWVEVDFRGKALSIDPTWMESPVDATHIELARIPDSNFTEYIEVKSSGVAIDWDKKEPEIRVLESDERPRFYMDAKIVPESMGSGSYALLMVNLTDAKPGRCVLSYVRAKSCTAGGDIFFSMDEANKTASFCGQGRVYWFLKAPELGKDAIYSCPVTLYGGGSHEVADSRASVDYGRPVDMYLGTMSVLTPGQRFNATVSIKNSGTRFEDVGVYLFFGGSILQEGLRIPPGESRALVAELAAPGCQGEYGLTAFSSSGQKAKENITVIAERKFEIGSISLPSEVRVNESFMINMTLKSMGNESRARIRVTIGEKTSEQEVDTREGARVNVIGKLEHPGSFRVSIALLSGDGNYQGGWRGRITAVNELSFFDSVMEWLRGALSEIAAYFRDVFSSLFTSG